MVIAMVVVVVVVVVAVVVVGEVVEVLVVVVIEPPPPQELPEPQALRPQPAKATGAQAEGGTAADAVALVTRRSMRSRPPRPVAGRTGVILAEAYCQQIGRFTTRVAVEGLASMQVSGVAGSWQRVVDRGWQ